MKGFHCLSAAAAMLLAGCSGFSSRAPADQIYLLRATTPPAAAAVTAVAPTLVVLLPSAAAGLESDRIALLTADGRLNYYSASRWAGELPAVLQTLLVDSLRAGGRFHAVLNEGAPFGADLVLQIEIRRFQAEYDGGAAPSAHLLLEATLGRRTGREVVRSFRIESRVPAQTDRMSAVVAAFNAALTDALQQLNAAVVVPSAAN